MCVVFLSALSHHFPEIYITRVCFYSNFTETLSRLEVSFSLHIQTGGFAMQRFFIQLRVILQKAQERGLFFSIIASFAIFIY